MNARPRRPLHVRCLRAAAVVAIAILTVALMGLPLYVFPAHDEPREVDAAYVIGPPTDARMALAESMVADGLTDTVVVSLSEDPQGERQAWHRAAQVCDAPEEQPFTVVCGEPDPFSTRGEARWIRTLIDQNGWDSVAVITFTAHLTRTRVIMERCWDGDMSYVDSGEPQNARGWVHNYLYQSAAFAKVALEQGC